MAEFAWDQQDRKWSEKGSSAEAETSLNEVTKDTIQLRRTEGAQSQSALARLCECQV